MHMHWNGDDAIALLVPEAPCTFSQSGCRVGLTIPQAIPERIHFHHLSTYPSRSPCSAIETDTAYQRGRRCDNAELVMSPAVGQAAWTVHVTNPRFW